MWQVKSNNCSFKGEDFGIESHLGEIGKVIELVDGKYKAATPPQGVSASQYKFESCPGPYSPGIVSKDVYENKTVPNKAAERKTAAYKLYDPFAIKEPLPILSFTNEELQEVSTIKTDMDNYVKEMKAKWVTGQRNVKDDWNEYVSTLKKMRVEKYVEINQKAYDRYKKN